MLAWIATELSRESLVSEKPTLSVSGADDLENLDGFSVLNGTQGKLPESGKGASESGSGRL